MKNYPDSLADLDILRSVLSTLYEHAEEDSRQAADYRRRAVEEGVEPDSWLLSEAMEYEAKAAARLRLAKRLEK